MSTINYSAESTLQDINAVDDLQHKIDCIKQYAKQIAQQTLNDAIERYKNIDYKTDPMHCEISVILETPIVLY